MNEWLASIRKDDEDGVATPNEHFLLAHLDALTAAVEALKFVPDEDVEGWEWISRSDVLAILRGEQ